MRVLCKPIRLIVYSRRSPQVVLGQNSMFLSWQISTIQNKKMNSDVLNVEYLIYEFGLNRLNIQFCFSQSSIDDI